MLGTTQHKFAPSAKDYPTDMNDTLAKAFVALAPVGMLLFGSAFTFFRERTVPSVLQLLGAGCLLIVVINSYL